VRSKDPIVMPLRRVGSERKGARLEERRSDSQLLLLLVELVVKVEAMRGEERRIGSWMLSCCVELHHVLREIARRW